MEGGFAARPGLQSSSFGEGYRRLRAAPCFSGPCTVIVQGLAQSNATVILIIRLRQDYSEGVRGPCGAIAYTRVSRHPRAGPRAVSRTGSALPLGLVEQLVCAAWAGDFDRLIRNRPRSRSAIRARKKMRDRCTTGADRHHGYGIKGQWNDGIPASSILSTRSACHL